MSTTVHIQCRGVAADEPEARASRKSRPAGEGVTWIGAGWRLFAKAPLMWIVALLVLVVIAIVVSLVPIIGSIAFQIVTPVFYGGPRRRVPLARARRRVRARAPLRRDSRNFGKLAILGVLFLVGWLVIMVVVGLIAGMGIVMAIVSGNPNDVAPAAMASGMAILLGVLVMLALMVPLLMAYWFAPALVIMHDMGAVAAMKASFGGACATSSRSSCTASSCWCCASSR